MAKPEYQALLLMNSLPRTSLCQDFKPEYPIQNRWKSWNSGYYQNGEWIFTLDFIQKLLHLFHTYFGRRKKAASEEPRPLRTPGAPWRIPGTAPARVNLENLSDSDMESSQDDNLTPRLENPSTASRCESSSSSRRSTLTSKKRRRN